jgi:hypothetical protein
MGMTKVKLGLGVLALAGATTVLISTINREPI